MRVFHKFLSKEVVIKLIKFDEIQFRILLLTKQHNRMISMLQMLILVMSVTLGVSPQIKEKVKLAEFSYIWFSSSAKFICFSTLTSLTTLVELIS